MTKFFAFFLLPFYLSILEMAPTFFKPILSLPKVQEDEYHYKFKNAFGFGVSEGGVLKTGIVKIKPEL